MTDLPSFLETLYGHGDGWVHLSTLNRQVAAAKCSEVAKLADKMSGQRDVYLSAAIIGTDRGSGDNGRIVDEDATQLTALWVDLDREGEPGHKTEARLWSRDDIGQLLEVLPLKPTAIVDSGGGWWFFFTLTEPVPLGEDGRGELLLARWARYWHGLADERGRHMDGVFNAGRIVRAPGSINGKEEGRIAVIKSLYPERTYTADQLDAILPAPEPPAPSYTAGSDGDRPGDDYNRAATAASMVALLERHDFHSPRSVGGRIDLTRLGKKSRDGHSVTVWADATVTFWSSAPEGLPGTVTLRDKYGASGTYDPFGVYVHVEHGGDFKAAAKALNPEADFKIPEPTPRPPSAAPVGLSDALDVYRKWFGDEYDIDVAVAVLAAAAAAQLNGDPLWLLVVSGPGAAKTETAQSLKDTGARIISTLSGEAALLSGTSAKQRAKTATGGLLREIGDRGLLVIKDVTSILTMNRDTRSQLLAALREIHDGYWVRRMGVDGGRVIEWEGRVVVIGAVTTAWDQSHAVISTMGDRFVLIRLDSGTGRSAAGRRAARNSNQETTMRRELAAAAAGVIAGMDPDPPLPGNEEIERLLAAADLVTLARTGVEYDYRGDVIDSHAPEMPTRFLKQLIQLFRGAIAIGMDRTAALELAIRCARDSMPPLRLAIIDDLSANPHSTASDIRRRIDRPWTTVDRQCQSLYMLGVLACDEEAFGQSGKSRWYYELAAATDPTALQSSPLLSPHTHRHTGKESEKVRKTESPNTTSDKAGEGCPTPESCAAYPFRSHLPLCPADDLEVF